MIPRSKFLALFFLPLVINAKALPDISMEVLRYQSSASPYIEVSLYVAGASLACKAEQDQEYGIGYILIIRDAVGNIVVGNRYELTSKGCPANDIMDVKRYTLPAGEYNVDLEAFDISDTLGLITASQDINLATDPAVVFLSDVALLSTIKPEQVDKTSLNKSGMYLEPLPFRLYFPALKHLYAYLETYHVDQLKGQPYVQYKIAPIKGDLPAPIMSYKKLKKEDVNANVFDLDISGLVSGHYLFEASIFDGDKKLVAETKTYFSRLNPKGDSLYFENASLQAEDAFVNALPADSLDYFMRAMAPVVNSMDVEVMNMLLDKGSDKAKRFFIHRYWTEQAGKLGNVAFRSYIKVALAIDAEFDSGFGYGFETDRGHVFMKYGKPDEILPVEDEPSAPPYEIWFYHQLEATHQNNVRFLFYNPSLAKNAFKLLHSTAIGEVRNDRWEVELYRDATLEAPGVNVKEMGENVNRNARRYFEQ